MPAKKRTIIREPGPARVLLDALGTDAFVDRVTGGETMRGIAESLGIHHSTVVKWIAADKEREKLVHHARIAAARAFDEEAESLLRNAKNKFALMKAREVASHLRWRSRVADPATYGERLAIDATTTVMDMSNEQIQRRLADLLAKRDAALAPPSTDGAG